MLFYGRILNICEFWYLWGSWKESLMEMKGQLYICISTIKWQQKFWLKHHNLSKNKHIKYSKSASHTHTHTHTHTHIYMYIYQFSSVAQSCPTLCDPMNHSMPGLPVHHQLPESTQTHVHWVGDAIQPSLPLLSPSPPALNLSQHQGLFQWVSSSHQVAKVYSYIQIFLDLWWSYILINPL